MSFSVYVCVCFDWLDFFSEGEGYKKPIWEEHDRISLLMSEVLRKGGGVCHLKKTKQPIRWLLI